MKSIRLSYGESSEQFGDLRLPDGKGLHPLVILIHGGFWKKGYGLELMEPLSEALAEQGYATWNIEYRRVGSEEGGWPNTLLDTAKAADFARNLAEEHPIDLSRIAAIGHSAGGHLALWLAARNTLESGSQLFIDNPLEIGVSVSLAGVGDLALMGRVHQINERHQGVENNPTRELMGGTPEEVPERYKEASPYERLPLNVKQVLIHGELDIHVPVGMSEHYFDKAISLDDQAELIKLESAEHFKLIEADSEVFPILLEEIGKVNNHEK